MAYDRAIPVYSFPLPPLLEKRPAWRGGDEVLMWLDAIEKGHHLP